MGNQNQAQDGDKLDKPGKELVICQSVSKLSISNSVDIETDLDIDLEASNRIGKLS